MSDRLVRLVQLATLLGLVIAGLLGWRLWQVRHQVYVAEGESELIVEALQLDGVTVHLLLPRLREARVVVPDRPHQPQETHDAQGRSSISRRRAFAVSTNSMRLRGAAEVGPKQGRRVLLVGDSVAFGWGVEDEEDLATHLAKELGAEVLNGGVPGMQSGEIGPWAGQLATELDPDLVLVVRRPGLDQLDGMAATVRRIQGATQAPVALILSPVSTFDPRGRREQQAVLQAMEQRLGRTPVLDPTPGFRAAIPDHGVVLELDGQDQRVVEAGSGRQVLQAQASGDWLAPEVVALFEEDHQIHEPLFFDGGHADAEGSQVFARIVAAWISEQGLLTSP